MRRNLTYNITKHIFDYDTLLANYYIIDCVINLLFNEVTRWPMLFIEGFSKIFDGYFFWSEYLINILLIKKILNLGNDNYNIQTFEHKNFSL